MQGIRLASFAIRAAGDDFKNIIPGQGIKYRFYIVVSVFPFGSNVQPDIDLTVGEFQQGARI
jgi:hypothetical protein